MALNRLSLALKWLSVAGAGLLALTLAGERFLWVERPLAKADAIVVLAGGGAYRERATAAAALYRAARAPRVLLTDDGSVVEWSRREQRNLLAWELAARVLTQAGVPLHNVMTLSRPEHTGTFGELQAVDRYRRANGLGALVFVTSDYHTRRVAWVLRRLGVCEPSFGLVGARAPWSDRWWLRWISPERFPDVWSEYVKLAYYAVRYR